jgi:hypothetical protein
LSDFPGTDSAAQTNNARVKSLLRWFRPMIPLLPVLKLIEETAVAIDSGKDLQERNIVPLGEEVLQGHYISIIHFLGADGERVVFVEFHPANT